MLKRVNWYSVQVYDFTSDDLQDLGEIGRGAFGTVNKMVHRRSNTVMAVKVEYSIMIVKFALVKIQWYFNVTVIDFTFLWICACVCWYCWKYYYMQGLNYPWICHLLLFSKPLVFCSDCETHVLVGFFLSWCHIGVSVYH